MLLYHRSHIKMCCSLIVGTAVETKAATRSKFDIESEVRFKRRVVETEGPDERIQD